MPAGYASQVGYQNDQTSRFAWYRDPAPPSKSSYEGGLSSSVRIPYPLSPQARGPDTRADRAVSRRLSNPTPSRKQPVTCTSSRVIKRWLAKASRLAITGSSDARRSEAAARAAGG